MAKIPYGYKIVRGLAEIDSEQGEKVKLLFKNYLSGMSVRTAKDATGIQRGTMTVRHILQNPIYIGSDPYYPAIIDQATFDEAQKVRAERLEALGGPHTRKKPDPAEAIKKKFKLGEIPEKGSDDPAQMVAELYGSIHYDPNGEEECSAGERSVLRKALKNVGTH